MESVERGYVVVGYPMSTSLQNLPGVVPAPVSSATGTSRSAGVSVIGEHKNLGLVDEVGIVVALLRLDHYEIGDADLFKSFGGVARERSPTADDEDRVAGILLIGGKVRNPLLLFKLCRSPLGKINAFG